MHQQALFKSWDCQNCLDPFYSHKVHILFYKGNQTLARTNLQVLSHPNLCCGVVQYRLHAHLNSEFRHQCCQCPTAKTGIYWTWKYISNFTNGSTLRVAHVFGPYSRQNIKKIPFAWDTKRDFCSLYNRAILRHFSSHPRTWRDMQSALALSAFEGSK